MPWRVFPNASAKRCVIVRIKHEACTPRRGGKLREEGYSFATVSELLTIPGSKLVTSEICYDSKPADTDKYEELARKLTVRYARVIARIRANMHSAPSIK